MPVAPRVRLIALLATVTMLAGACSQTSATTDAAAGEPEVEVTTTTPIPDPLPDPNVAPGSCKVLTYTPPGAPEAQQGELCRPPDDQRDVAVMVVHGGSGIGGSRDGMRPWAHRLMAEGYVVFMPEYHLFTPGSTETPVFPLPEQEVKAAVQYLRGTANAIGIDRDRVVVQGQSAGARIGAVAYATPDDPYFAGPMLWPEISDEVNGFIGYYHPFDGSMQYSAQYYGGLDDSTIPAVRERWDHADSLAQADHARGPALFITGSKDWSLQVDQQSAFADALHSRGIQSTTLVIDGGGHGFDQAGDRLTRLGEQAATAELTWLNDQFPQDPPRPAQTVPPDLTSAPNSAGTPPPTFDPRSRPSTTGRGSPPTTMRPTAPSPGLTPTTTAPSAPTTTAPPPTTTTSAAPTTTVTVPPGDGHASPP